MNMKPWAIVGGQILQKEGFIKNKSILIKGNRIDAVLSKIPQKEIEVIHVKGCRVIPGFIDLHLHCDLPDNIEDPESYIQKISIDHARYGTTRFLSAFCTSSLRKLEVYSNLLKSLEKTLNGAQILGVHLEGPFINPIKSGAQSKLLIRKPSVKMIHSILEMFGRRLKILTLAPELKGATDIIKVLKKKGVCSAIGHSNANYDEAQVGIKAGVSYGTHLFNQMKSFHHREPGVAGAILMDDRVFAELIADGMHLSPLMVKLVYKVKGPEKLILATDCFADISRNDSGLRPPRLKDGTLAGSSISLRRAVLNLIKFSGVSLEEGIRTATLNPAVVLGIDKQYGSLEPGKIADIVVIDSKFNVKLTMVGGRIVYRSL